MARVLCSRYLQGKMSEAEWEFRKTEPMFNTGPVNLRPFLDSDWYNSGGVGNVSIDLYIYKIPAAHLGLAAGLAPGSAMTPHLGMLSKPRFFHRCQTVKQRVAEYIRHPLYFYTNIGYFITRLHRFRDVAIRWRSGHLEEGEGLNEASLFSPEEEASAGYIFNHCGATR